MPAWPVLLSDTAAVVASTIALIGTATVLYTGAAVGVALFHPDKNDVRRSVSYLIDFYASSVVGDNRPPLKPINRWRC
jgi:hypothetical protein